jgi:methylamine utilization protein MauE
MDAALGTSIALLARAAALGVGLVLLAAAWHKARDWAAFRGAVENYDLLPAVLVVPVAVALPAFEAAAGVALLTEPLRAAGAALGVVAIGTATAAVAISVVRGRTAIDCGCGGLEGRQRPSWALAARNGVLIAVLVVGTAVPLPDAADVAVYAALAATTLLLVALYATASQLVANRPLLAELRSR